MPANVTCPNPNCGKSYQVSAEYLGRRGRCKSCGTEFVFTAADSEVKLDDQSGISSVGAGNTAQSSGTTRGGRTAAPARLGRFEILERVGMGGFGAVYRAHDPQLQRTAALKLLQSTGDKKRDKQRIDRFLVEGRAGARLQHPNIVPVFDAGQDEESGEYYLAAAFIAGKPLSAAVDGKPIELRRTATIVAKLSRALDYAHGQGILHRDVKPDNVMLDEKDNPHLMDFGLARMEESESHITRDGSVMGTPSYMSPEQCIGKLDALGPSADQYSLGCLFYELLTGEKLFDGPVSVQIHHQINTEASAPSKKNAVIPRDLDTICLKTLAKDPANRYASCAAFAADLEHWLADEPIQARQLTTWERWNRWRKRNPAIAGLSLGLAAALLIGLFGITTQWIRAENHARRALLAVEDQKKAKEAAEAAEKTAVDARNAAEESAVIARREKDRADEQTAAAVQTARTLEREVYKQRIARAYQEWQDDYVNQAEQLLEDCPEVLRGWEWHYCHRLCRQELVTFGLHKLGVAAAVFSPDGKTAASASNAGEVRLWDAETGAVRFSFDFPLQQRYRLRSQILAFTPDGQKLAAACEDGIVRVWDVPTGKEYWKLEGQGVYVASLAISPNGQRLSVGTSGFGNGAAPVVVNVWDLSTKQLVSTLEGHLRSVTGLSYNKSGTQLATADWNGKIQLWDAQTGAKQKEYRTGYDGGTFCVAFHPNEQTLATGSLDDSIRILEAATGKLLNTLTGHSGDVMALSYSPDGLRLASGGGRAVKIWDTASGQELRTIRGYSGWLTTVNFAPDNRRVVSAGDAGTVKIWDANRDQEFVKFDFRTGQPNSDWIRSVKFSLDSQLLAVGSAGMQLFEAAGGTNGPKSLGLAHPYCIDFSADGTRVAAGGDSFVKVWSVSDGAEIASIPSGPGNRYVQCIAFSPDGNRLAWTSQKLVNVVEIKTGALLRSYDRHEEFLHWVAFAPDGRDIASLSDDGIVRMWNADTGADRFSRPSPQPKDAWKLTNGTGNNLCFSPKGYLAVGGGVMNKHGAIELWDPATGKTVGTMQGHSSIVTAIAFILRAARNEVLERRWFFGMMGVGV